MFSLLVLLSADIRRWRQGILPANGTDSFHSEATKPPELHTQRESPQHRSRPVLPHAHTDHTTQSKVASEQYRHPLEQHGDLSEQYRDLSVQRRNSSQQYRDSTEQNRDSSVHLTHSPEPFSNSLEEQRASSKRYVTPATEQPRSSISSPKLLRDSPQTRVDSPKYRDSLDLLRNSPRLRRHSAKQNQRQKDPTACQETTSAVETEDLTVENMKDPPQGRSDRWEQQRRLDAWVSSIQTHWESGDSAGDFPFSFEDNFPGLEDDVDLFSDFPVSLCGLVVVVDMHE